MSVNQTEVKLTTLFLFSAIPLHFIACRRWLEQRKQTISPSSQHHHGSDNTLIRPPFPKLIRQMLSSCKLSYLSTVEGNSSHLSLMRFTYLDDEDDGEVLIMTTRKHTKKYSKLEKQDNVALLIHDFPQFEGNDGNKGVHSITLNGRCNILENGSAKAEEYRAKHLKQNADYPQFIVGVDIMVLRVVITSASICNINDKVTNWSVEDSSVH
jgi:general stress protein 26